MLEVDVLFSALDQDCNVCIKNLQDEFDDIQIGRANTGIIEKIKVNVYGGSYIIRDLATVSILDNKNISVKVWDRNNAGAIDKAIISSDLGLTTIKEGELIRIPIPPVTTEKRTHTIKLIKTKAEQFKVSMRSIRHNFIDRLKKEKKSLAEDDYKSYIKKVDKIIKEFINKIDEITSKKIEKISN